MKKILNLTTNEMADCYLESNVVHNPPLNIADVASVSQTITHKIIKKSRWWTDDDEYKIVEV